MRDILLDNSLDIKDLAGAVKADTDWVSDPSLLLTSKNLNDVLRYLLNSTDRTSKRNYFTVGMQLLALRPDLREQSGLFPAEIKTEEGKSDFLKLQDDISKVIDAYEDWLMSKEHRNIMNGRGSSANSEADHVTLKASEAVAVRTLYRETRNPTPIGRLMETDRVTLTQESIEAHLLGENILAAYAQYQYAAVFFPYTARKLAPLFKKEAIVDAMGDPNIQVVHDNLAYLAMLRVMFPEESLYCIDYLRRHKNSYNKYLENISGRLFGVFMSEVLFNIHVVLADQVTVNRDGIKLVVTPKPRLLSDHESMPQTRSYQ